MSPLSGSFTYIDNSHKARMESPLLPWKPFHQSVGVCLRFNYLMPTKSKSSLKVFLRDTKREMLVVVWQLVGYHGKEWSVAQVAWPGAVGMQVCEQFHFYLKFLSHLWEQVLIDKVFHDTPFDPRNLFRFL